MKSAIALSCLLAAPGIVFAVAAEVSEPATYHLAEDTDALWSYAEPGERRMPSIDIVDDIYPDESGVQFLVDGEPDDRNAGARPDGFDATGPQDDSTFHVYPEIDLVAGMKLEARWRDGAGTAHRTTWIVGESRFVHGLVGEDLASWTHVDPSGRVQPTIMIADSIYPNERGVQFIIDGQVYDSSKARPGGFDATGPQDGSEFHAYPKLKLSAGMQLEARWIDRSRVGRSSVYYVGSGVVDPATALPNVVTPTTVAPTPETTTPPTTTPPTTTAPTTTIVVTLPPTTTQPPVVTLPPTTQPPSTQPPATQPPATTVAPPTTDEGVSVGFEVDGDDPNPVWSSGSREGLFRITPYAVPAGFPTPATVGVPEGTTLTPSGGLTITEPGTVIDGLDITGTVRVDADNVTIRNSRITGSAEHVIKIGKASDGRTYENFVIEDSRIRGVGECAATIAFSNYTARRVYITGCADGAKAFSNTTIVDSAIAYRYKVSDPANSGGGTHNDGIQSSGGRNIVIRGNTILGAYQHSTSAIKVTAEQNDLSDVVIEGNYLSGGAFTVYTTQKSYRASNIAVRNNTFEVGSSLFGETSNSAADATYSGNILYDPR